MLCQTICTLSLSFIKLSFAATDVANVVGSEKVVEETAKELKLGEFSYIKGNQCKFTIKSSAKNFMDIAIAVARFKLIDLKSNDKSLPVHSESEVEKEIPENQSESEVKKGNPENQPESEVEKGNPETQLGDNNVINILKYITDNKYEFDNIQSISRSERILGSDSGKVIAKTVDILTASPNEFYCLVVANVKNIKNINILKRFYFETKINNDGSKTKLISAIGDDIVLKPDARGKFVNAFVKKFTKNSAENLAENFSVATFKNMTYTTICMIIFIITILIGFAVYVIVKSRSKKVKY